MKAGPDISRIAALVGDPARCNMLTALMTGRALTASELAQEAGITPQTASSHLAKLEAGGLIEPEKQGRHRYYRLSDPDVADVLEGLQGIAARAGHMRVRTGPKDPALRRARICYDHLAGDLGVQMLDSMKRQKLVRQSKQAIELTGEGKRFMAEELQIDADALTAAIRRAMTNPPKVLVVTNYDTDADILGAIEAGAVGYLLKDAPPTELVAAVRSAAEGDSALSPVVADRLMTRVRTPRTSLTPRELEVLKLVAAGSSNREIGVELMLSEATVKSHLVHIYDKLGVRSRTSAVAAAREQGVL